MTTTKAAHTAGPVEVALSCAGELGILAPGGKYIAFMGQAGCLKSDAMVREANAALIAEAFNVATETGMTPRQLAECYAAERVKCSAYDEQRAELLAALKWLLTHANIADAVPEDVGEEDRTLERTARAAIATNESIAGAN